MLLHQGPQRGGRAKEETQRGASAPVCLGKPGLGEKAPPSPAAASDSIPHPALGQTPLSPRVRKPSLKQELIGRKDRKWPRRDNEPRPGGDREGVAEAGLSHVLGQLAPWPL